MIPSFMKTSRAPRTVASILVAFHDAVADLQEHAAEQEAAAAEHQTEIDAAIGRKLYAQGEAYDATRIAAKLTDIVGVP